MTMNSDSSTMYQFLECKVRDYMTSPARTLTRQVAMRELEQLFEKYDFNAFPVVEDGVLVGIVTKFDFLRTFAFTTGQVVPHFDELMKRTVAEVMTVSVMQVDPTMPLTRVLHLMVDTKSRSFPVMGPGNEVLGMISREDVMRALRISTQASR
jgi:CBS domain-containing protein